MISSCSSTGIVKRIRRCAILMLFVSIYFLRKLLETLDLIWNDGEPRDLDKTVERV